MLDMEARLIRLLLSPMKTAMVGYECTHCCLVRRISSHAVDPGGSSGRQVMNLEVHGVQEKIGHWILRPADRYPPIHTYTKCGRPSGAMTSKSCCHRIHEQ